MKVEEFFDENEETMSCGHKGKNWATELKICIECAKKIPVGPPLSYVDIGA
ncbi:MAG: hypothetical protein AABY22_18485 [Nanoarchaeota archaeon]